MFHVKHCWKIRCLNERREISTVFHSYPQVIHKDRILIFQRLQAKKGQNLWITLQNGKIDYVILSTGRACPISPQT